MNVKLMKPWNLSKMSKIGRCKFFSYMLALRLSFDIAGNATYATVWSFIFFLIYAMLELLLVRARVRDVCGDVKSWTQFYGMGLVWGAVLVFITINPAFFCNSSVGLSVQQ